MHGVWGEERYHVVVAVDARGENAASPAQRPIVVVDVRRESVFPLEFRDLPLDASASVRFVNARQIRRSASFQARVRTEKMLKFALTGRNTADRVRFARYNNEKRRKQRAILSVK